MIAEISHMIDRSEPDQDGSYDWYYEYDIFRFSIDRATLVARSYVDENTEAHFLRIEIDGKSRPLTLGDLQSDLATDAIRHLRNSSKTTIRWLSPNGYAVVPRELL